MSVNSDNPTIAFLWQPKDITSAAIQSAKNNRTTIIYDLTNTDFESAVMALLQADASADAVNIKIAPSVLGDARAVDLIKETGINKVWVELTPHLEDDLPGALDCLSKAAAVFEIIPIVGACPLIRHILENHPEFSCIALKGCEASGFVSSETIFTLYSSTKELLRRTGGSTGLAIWGGLAAPEAAAAFLATGAKGLVFESVHWLTDLVSTSEGLRQKLSNIRPDHTDLIGLNLDAPCRFFNKGNSKAVKKLKDVAGSLCGEEITDEIRARFVHEIQSNLVAPLESAFGREELIPLGVEAAFAASFVRRFGSGTEQAIDGFVTAIETCLADAKGKLAAFSKSATADQMGTRYPFIQGAMSWITDNPEFARKVADAGALPTIALGLMDEKILNSRLGNLPAVMEGRPFAVNVITLNENPYRDIQLAWIIKTKPKFAVIAAGEPSHAEPLIAAGIETIYIAPTEELMKLAFDAGIKYVICEGAEAGGHIGNHTTMTLAQIILDLKDKTPDLFAERKIILAGGICDRETTFMAAMLGADAVQMGTIYLTSAEIVETGALTSLYQRMIVESVSGETVITGEGTGLRVRSLKTPRINALCSLERDFASGNEDESSFRQKIEALSAGSLFVAARGLDRSSGLPMAESDCMEQGQFMSGACAGAISKIRDLVSIHTELATGALAEGLPLEGPLRVMPKHAVDVEPLRIKKHVGRPLPASAQDGRERIAITGMSVVNSIGNSPAEVWANSFAMKSGIVAVPASKWNHELFYNPRPRMSEKTYCKVAAFQNIDISRKDIGMPPQDFRTMTDATKITMWLAKNAIEESGILNSDIPRERIAVLVSQNSGEAAVTLQDVIIRGCSDKIVSAVKRVVDLSPDAEKAVAEEVKSGRLAVDDTTLLGRLNCSAGGFICNKYGFMGPSFSVSAACATALVALYSAYQMIRNGIIDAAVIGGGEEYLTPLHFLEFSALGALAGLSGIDRAPWETSRPFDADRDGMVLGEGGGVIVIERESLAKQRGAKIHACITSMGASNNHLGMVESSRITQEIAIKSSFRDAGYGPEKVDMVECHATSTRQGDQEEVNALRASHDIPGKRTILTSFKSQIGHTLGASGVNSLIRGIMAMNAGVYPPTLNFKHPDPEISVNGSGLEILSEPADWLLKNGDPRRMQVNAFGFGGSNYVVQIEQTMEHEDTVLVSPVNESEITAGEQVEAPDGVSFFTTEIGDRTYRLAVPAETDEKAIDIINRTEPLANGGPIAPKRMKSLTRQGIYISPDDPAPKLAFVFPGQGSHYAGMGHELYENFPIIKQWMDRANDVAEFDILELLFHNTEEDLQKTRWQQPALFTMEYTMVQHLWSLGLRPSALAGHSLGELTALCLAGVYSFEDGFRIVNMRAICMDRACSIHVDPGVMMAVDAPLDVLEEMMARKEKVYITNINSPHQLVAGGNTEQIKELGIELKANGYRNTLLRVSMAFHSPVMECIHDDLEAFIAEIEFHAPQIPVISNTTMRPFPDDPAEIKRIVMAHLESPVHWMQNVQTMWDDFNIRLFVEVGPREILTNLISDCIEESDCIPTCLPSAETVMLRNAISQLYAKGNLKFSKPCKSVRFPKTEKAAEPAPVAASASLVSAAPARQTTALEHIVQREIGSFVLESFGRFLKPTILAAIRSEYNPQFSDANLENLFGQMFPGLNHKAAVPLPAGRAPEMIPPGVMSPASPTARIQDAQKPVAVAKHAHGEEDTTETVIRIIMEATGYEREEIEPDMDLREDLSIRSSRLPVIMDSVEGHFGIKIELEDFMDVRTIRDISERISVIISRDKHGKGHITAIATAKALPPAKDEAAHSVDDKQSLKRIVFREAPAEAGTVQPVELTPLDTVAVFCAERGTGLRKRVGDVIRRDYGSTILPMTFLEELDAESAGFDLRTEEGVAQATEKLNNVDSLAGVVFVLDDVLETQLNSMTDISALMKGFFSIVKTFSESGSKKFAIALHRTDSPRGNGRLLSEGMLGMFLSAAQEFGSVQFRTVRLDDNTDLRDAIRGSLDRSQKSIELIWHNGESFTREGTAAPAQFDEAPQFKIDADDVVVFTGGCSGIAPFIAKSLIPLGAKLIFVGRTVLDPQTDYQDMQTPEDLKNAVARKYPEKRGKDLKREISGAHKALDVINTIRDLKSKGIDAAYYSADVTDPGAVEALASEITDKFGKITGIVHGAGIIKDNFIRQMSESDFGSVLDVKFLGAWNLFQAARKAGLRFFVCFSSAACIQGNPGQSNYAAGNRVMSAFASHMAQRHSSIRFKALMLPPIAGAGMAEDPEIRELMKRMNASYVHADELAGLFCRELLFAPSKDVWVMFMRSLPDLSTARLNPKTVIQPNEIQSAGVSFRKENFPMIDSVTSVDLQKGELVATRSFSLNHDLWISDHKPFKFMKHPLVSAIMAIETFMEASKILYPYMEIKGIRNAEFLDIIECPPGVDRSSEISCKRIKASKEELECELILATREISPTGRMMERITPNYRAQVILGHPSDSDFQELDGFPVTVAELDSRPMDKDEVIQWYADRTDMQDRYRIVEDLDGTGQGAVRGHIVYRTSTDFKKPRKSNYLYSPYLLEAMMQVVNFYIVMRDTNEERSMIPFKIGSMIFRRKCVDGEKLVLEARMREQDEEGITWDTRAIDQKGQVVMVAENVRMRWFVK